MNVMQIVNVILIVIFIIAMTIKMHEDLRPRTNDDWQLYVIFWICFAVMIGVCTTVASIIIDHFT
ncbi:hypothetical protein SEA_NICEHOUSE_131 [Rhodococcus phage NiceHouse]|nr:hypothetical protein SEA_NICEHOUSE_131 [Rhodococcus phage NiceHouse]